MNSFTLFSEPKKAFSEVFDKLKKAKHCIYMEAYELKDDHIGRELIRILARKSLEIKVILIVDDYGFESPSKTTARLLRDSSIEFIRFNPVWSALREKHLSKMARFVLRSHRKLTIIDERIAYTGGTNYTAQEIRWRDIFVSIKGPLVADLTRAFFEMRRMAKKKFILNMPVNKKLTKRFQGTDILIRQVPHTFHRPLRKELSRLFAQAKDEICITTPYFVPTVAMTYMLFRAMRKGVKVKILIPYKSDQYWVDIVSDFFAYLMFKKKAQVFLQKRMSHAKYIIVDRSVCTFGSANFDYQTFHNNHELNIITKEQDIVQELHDLFREDCEKSLVFSKKTRRNRTVLRKLFEKILHPFKKYF
ncbi:MAG: phosphatidylserine/phosphatidylglycerophosphate/cardiolipin synthase family protein [Nanoarchaeota archaeon]|nr:phosphatidylserine/phosphatidylglycerophosphate/cardiolipin synthase family protein [Nanoarchaeota archaeon]